MLHKLTALTITGPETILVTYEDGRQVEFSVRSLIEQGGVFSKLADPEYFNQAEIGERGRFLTWPGELEICADAIRVGLPQTVTS